METTKYIWMNGEFIPWEDAKIHVVNHTLHYGSWAFEGTRVYLTDKWPVVYRLIDHTKRLFYSAGVLKMDVPFSEEEINDATIELVRKNNLTDEEADTLYLRHIIYYWGEKMGVNPSWAKVNCAIIWWLWPTYIPEVVNVKISKYIRIHPKSLVQDAKISGHYVNSILASQEINGTNYDEALLLDFEWNIAEWPWENFFIIKNWDIITPPLGRILKWLTRDTVFEICKKLGYKIIERAISPQEALDADEAFFTGTAAKVAAIATIDDNKIWNGEMGPITKEIRASYGEIIHGKDPEFEHYLSYVN